ncbi:WD40 repeat-like protein [Pseudohyphozyma bogoriensis]|nr:WD40 repeat-like protein [Pseudohyphozyma bogoriensis]
MSQTAVIPSKHNDLITSLAFNSFGTRLATGSLDHSIRVASLSPTTGQWDADVSEFKHDSAVLKVTFAHPEFGVLLASGGVDGVVRLWTEQQPTKPLIVNSNAVAPPRSNWVAKASLTDARGTIRDLDFCPPELGLKLACISSDSHLRLWECLDPVSLSDWSLIEDIDLSLLPYTPSSSTATPQGAGSTSKSFDGSASPVRQAPMSGTSVSSSSVASSSDGRKNGTVESDGGWAVSWCKEAWWGERLAVSAGPSGMIRLFHLPDHAPWNNYLNLLPPRASASAPSVPPTSSISWAPSSGRSYQLLAAGARDGRARVWKLHTPSLDPEFDGPPSEEWKAELDAELDDGSAKTGSIGNVKVEWNITGTVLSTAGDDAKVRLWKSTYTGQWRVIAVLKTDEDDGGMAVDK